jgi:hypothetical protein
LTGGIAGVIIIHQSEFNMNNKRISRDDLKAIVQTRLHVGMVLNRLQYYYCRPMNRMGQCTTRCQDCADNIRHIVGEMKIHNSRDPYAVLVWRIRDRLAEIAEQSETCAEPRTNWLGQPVETNIFEQVIQDIGG